MVSRETQDNGWIIKGSPVERRDSFDIFATTYATYIPSLFLHPPAFPIFFFFRGSYHLFSSSPAMIPGCHMQMEDTAVGLMLINTVQIFI